MTSACVWVENLLKGGKVCGGEVEDMKRHVQMSSVAVAVSSALRGLTAKLAGGGLGGGGFSAEQSGRREVKFSSETSKFRAAVMKVLRFHHPLICAKPKYSNK